MKITIVSCVFPPEPIVSASTSAEIARACAAQGHAVRVITNFPNRPAGRLYLSTHRGLYRRDVLEGIPLLRCFNILSRESSLLTRLLENLSFGFFSALVVLFIHRPDVIYANTWPLFAQGMLAEICRLRGIPLVLSVQDLYPESLVSQGRIKAGASWPFRLIRAIDRHNARRAVALVVISDSFRRAYVEERGIPAWNVHVIPNWIDEQKVDVNANGTAIRRQHGINAGDFLAVYAGNVGMAAGVETLVQAWKDVPSSEPLRLLIAGSGSSLEALCCQAEACANRVCFHTPWLDVETSQVLLAADLLLLPTRGRQSLVSLPSKLLAYMLSGRAVLALAQPGSDLARIITDSGCGWVITPDDPAALLRELRCIASLSREELRSRGNAGRQYTLQLQTSRVNLPRIMQLLEHTGVAHGR